MENSTEAKLIEILMECNLRVIDSVCYFVLPVRYTYKF